MGFLTLTSGGMPASSADLDDMVDLGLIRKQKINLVLMDLGTEGRYGKAEVMGSHGRFLETC